MNFNRFEHFNKFSESEKKEVHKILDDFLKKAKVQFYNKISFNGNYGELHFSLPTGICGDAKKIYEKNMVKKYGVETMKGEKMAILQLKSYCKNYMGNLIDFKSEDTMTEKIRKIKFCNLLNKLIEKGYPLYKEIIMKPRDIIGSKFNDRTDDINKFQSEAEINIKKIEHNEKIIKRIENDLKIKKNDCGEGLLKKLNDENYLLKIETDIIIEEIENIEDEKKKVDALRCQEYDKSFMDYCLFLFLHKYNDTQKKNIESEIENTKKDIIKKLAEECSTYVNKKNNLIEKKN